VTDPPTVSVRPARPEDVPTLVDLVVELAVFERARSEVELTNEKLDAALFDGDPQVYCDVAELDGVIVGSAIWFVTYSTWTGTHNLYLEDIYVRPSVRRSGVASQLMRVLARRAVERGYRRFEWSVLDWNVGAIGFYEEIGAQAMPEWVRYRLSGAALEDLGNP
jgi:GNAT superfamily N-acetyltransferase